MKQQTVKDELQTAFNLNLQAQAYYVLLLVLLYFSTNAAVALVLLSIIASGLNMLRLRRLMRSPVLYLAEIERRFGTKEKEPSQQ